MEAIKALLGEVLFAQVTEKLQGKELFLHDKGQKVLIDDGNLIPKHRLDEVLESKKALQAQITQNDSDLKALKKAAEGNTDLTAQIDSLQKASKDARVAAEQNEITLKKSFALKESLMNAGVSDADARDLLALKFDPTKVELDDKGKIKGFDEMLKPIKENKAFSAMFGTQKIAGQEHGHGGLPDANGELSTRLEAAQKTGNLVEVVSLKRQIWEAQQNALKQVS